MAWWRIDDLLKTSGRDFINETWTSTCTGGTPSVIYILCDTLDLLGIELSAKGVDAQNTLRVEDAHSNLFMPMSQYSQRRHNSLDKVTTANRACVCVLFFASSSSVQGMLM